MSLTTLALCVVGRWGTTTSPGEAPIPGAQPPRLKVLRRTDSDDLELLAKARGAAHDEARELGWICLRAPRTRLLRVSPAHVISLYLRIRRCAGLLQKGGQAVFGFLKIWLPSKLPFNNLMATNSPVPWQFDAITPGRVSHDLQP